MEKRWWKEAVVYQIYPRSFMDSNGDGIGDLKGIIMKLNYLQTLGVDVIWLSPIYQSPNDDNGYDISDYQAILAEFGTMSDFEQLLEELHNRGMKLMMDLVVNHTSDEHPWFMESRSSKDNSKRDYYIWRQGKNGQAPTNWESIFKGSTWEYDATTDEYYLHLFSKKQPDLNWENRMVRHEIYQMMKWWLDKGIDGFRMDAINFISKDSSYPDGQMDHSKQYGDGRPYFMNRSKTHDYLQEMNKEVLSKYDVMTVGETSGVDPEQAKMYVGTNSNELQMVFHFEHVELGGGPEGKWSNGEWQLTDLKRILTKWQKGLADDGWNSLYWNNHDQPRVVSRFGEDGEYREVSAKMLATCLHMMQGTPYIYQGEELGMTNVKFDRLEDYRDIETMNAYNELVHSRGWSHDRIFAVIHARSRDNARTPMQWDTSNHGGFTSGEPWIKVNPNYLSINSVESLKNPNSIYHYYQTLIRLRKQYEIVVYGSYELLLPEDEDVFAYSRTLRNEKLLVLCNFKPHDVDFTVSEKFTSLSAKLLIANYAQKCDCELNLDPLRPYECRVYYFQ